MYILENTKLKASIIGLGLSLSLGLTLAIAADSSKTAVDGGIKYNTKDGKYTSYYVNPVQVKYNNGRAATKKKLLHGILM